ncbi:hypothetical protein PsYK624_152690 [Phanerochaete sordida]|uniref:Uncharacterized protein n=1 Tax=Phanerochaete sordida TaxID=48140 RepID=A0A9P3GQJ5_9APHY|nr:hypothetical protein PsYK624_152690 [Phanerochaete sordida]
MANVIPEELFEHILWHACDYGFALPLRRETKTAISRSGQVCRYWARLSRRRLFGELVLRSATEFQQLRSFLAAPGIAGLEPIANLVFSIRAIVDGTGRPWLHNAASANQVMCNCEYFTVVVNPADGCPLARPHMLQAALPRSLPSGNVFKLVLDGLRFADGRALFRLLASVPSLCALDLHNIAFDAQPTTGDFFAPPYGWRLGGVVSDDLLALHFLPLLVASYGCGHPATRGRRERAPPYLLDVEDHRTLLHLLSILEGSVSADDWAVPPVECRRAVGRIHDRLYAGGPAQTCTLRLSPLAYTRAQCHIDIQLYLVERRGGARLGPEVLVHLTPDAPGAPAHGPTAMHVDAVHISFADTLAPAAADILVERTWARFAETALRLPRLRAVELVRPATLHDAALGVSDRAFAALIAAGRLRARWLEHAYSNRTVALRVNGTQRVPKERRGEVRS